ncbi:MAG: hypothetical protein ACE5Z5_03750 [Candidatus Bathyarchaeia archaeon]
MPFTALHLIPGLIVYLLLFPYVDLPALMIATVILDIEPFANLFLFHRWPLHGALHSPVGALLIVAPILTVSSRLLETRSRVLVKIVGVVGWRPRVRTVPLKATVSSVYTGIISHLVLDFWMHDDIPVFYPFGSGNPFRSDLLMIWSGVAVIAGLATTPLLYVIGSRLYRDKPFSHFP